MMLLMMQVKYIQHNIFEHEFKFTTDMNAAGKDVLLNARKPSNGTMLTKYPNLSGIKMKEIQVKATLSINVTSGVRDFSMIKT